jgi:hypothetical protein
LDRVSQPALSPRVLANVSRQLRDFERKLWISRHQESRRLHERARSGRLFQNIE